MIWLFLFDFQIFIQLQKHQSWSDQRESKKFEITLDGEVGLYSICERWGCIQAGVLLFQNYFLTGVVLGFEWGEALFKSGVAFKRIR